SAPDHLISSIRGLHFQSTSCTGLRGGRHVALYCYSRSARVFQLRHAADGHLAGLLFGQWHAARSPSSCFPSALALRLPLPLLPLPLWVAALRPRALANWAIAAAGVLLFFSLTCRVQIGVRYMLPLVALAIAGLSAAVVRTWEFLPSIRARRSLTLAA